MTTFYKVGQIVEDLLSKAEGNTVATHLGASVPKSGYVVGIKRYGTEVCSLCDDSGDQVLDWVKENYHNAGAPAHFLGIWLDYNTSIFYLDVVRVFAEKAAALAFAKEQEQIAIFDLSKNEEVRV